jgi:hypothetical protein
MMRVSLAASGERAHIELYWCLSGEGSTWQEALGRQIVRVNQNDVQRAIIEGAVLATLKRLEAGLLRNRQDVRPISLGDPENLFELRWQLAFDGESRQLRLYFFENGLCAYAVCFRFKIMLETNEQIRLNQNLDIAQAKELAQLTIDNEFANCVAWRESNE